MNTPHHQDEKNTGKNAERSFSPLLKLHSPPSKKASSLITTLLVLVVLSTIVVAFMQSMSIERNVARSVKNKLQAELAVNAGLEDASGRLSGILTANPYHAVGYTNVGNQTVTMIVGAPSYTNTSLTTTNYLLSLSNMTSPPSGLTPSNSVALNFSNTKPAGWIGSPVGPSGAISNRECRTPWIYILKDETRPHQPDSSQANHNPYIARYAYWIEDESSKIDIMVAGNANGPSGAYLKPTNMVRPQDTDFGAAPLIDGQPLATNAAATNSAFIAFRNGISELPLVQSFLPYVPGFSTNSVETSRFYTTMGSYASDLAGTGQKRININAIITDSFATNLITSDLDDLIYSITGVHPYAGLNNASDNGLFHNLPNTNGPIPNFGTRFYSGATTAHRNIYLKKIAANIRDYIDADSQPTLVNASGNVEGTSIPTTWWNNWPPQAIGKEAIPYLQETAWAGTEVSWTGSGSTRTATIEIDHYLEFFNPSTKPFVAPQGTKIQFSNGPLWEAGSFPAIEIEDFELDISGVSFPAGRVTVITTNPGPNANDPPSLILDTNTLVRVAPIPASARLYSNRLTDEIIGGQPGFQNQFVARDTQVADNQSRLAIYGTNGLYDANRAYGYTGSGSFYWNFKGTNVGDRRRFVYSSSLMGNSANGRSGDPRSLSEQLMFYPYASANQDNTRFYGNIQGNSSIPGTATLGRAALSFVDPTKNQGTVGAWGDYSTNFTDSSATAFGVISDSPISSIAELGHIFDPYRLPSPSGIEYSRGGGRTLKIGQPDDVIGNSGRFSTNWQNSAWRLTEIFGAGTNRSQSELDPVNRGKINVNSIMRDGGVALRSLLRSFVFLPSPHSDPNIAGKSINPSEINNLLLSISNYIVANGPIIERGELSQITYFSGASTNLRTLAGQPVRTTGDRGREEIFRRMAELITTRSASYSVYCVGEAIQESSTGKIKILSRANNGAVFRFDPIMGPGMRARATNFQTTKLYELQ